MPNVCCVISYTEAINGEKLIKAMRDYNNDNSDQKVSRSMHKYKLTEENINEELSGYEHGGVTPVLLNTDMPILISQTIADLRPRCFWLGGGFKDLKLSRLDFKFRIEFG